MWIALIIILVIILLFVLMYNKLVSMRNLVRNSWSQIDVQLQRRFDLIPNLVNTVKGYMKHESEVLEKSQSFVLHGQMRVQFQKKQNFQINLQAH